MDPPSDFDAVRARYTALREAQRALNKRLTRMLPKPAFKECGQKLGLWQHGQLVFDEEDHVAVYRDYMIYDYRLRGGTNAVERLRKLGEAKPGNRRIRGSRSNAVGEVHRVPGRGARSRNGSRRG